MWLIDFLSIENKQTRKQQPGKFQPPDTKDTLSLTVIFSPLSLS